MWFAEREKGVGIGGIREEIKERWIEGVRELEGGGIEVYMVRGEKEGSGGEIGGKGGMVDYGGGVVGEDKGAFMGRVEKNGKKVGMGGEGR